MKSGLMALLFICMFLPVAQAHSFDLFLADSGVNAPGLSAQAAAVARVPTAPATPAATEGSGDPGAPSVVRQRTALLDVDGLCGPQNVDSIRLQLFDDVELTAIEGKERRGPEGSLLLSAKIAGVEDGRIILVVRNHEVFASVYLPAAPGDAENRIIYQIRPLSVQSRGTQTSPAPPQANPILAGAPSAPAALHVIREIRCGSLAYGPQVRPQAAPILAGGPTAPAATKGSGVNGSAISAGGPTAPSAPGEEGKVIELVNLERVADGMAALQFNDKLAAAARGHAQDMALHDYCSHDRRDGSKFWQSILAGGYPVSKLGENLAVGLATPEEAFESLMSSPSHRATITDPEYTQIGVAHAVSPTGAYHHFWAQEFGAAGRQIKTAHSGTAASPAI